MIQNFSSLKTEKITVLYARLSQDDGNAGDSNSIVNQRQMLTDFAKKMAFRNCRFFADDGISGTTFERPAFQEAVALVDAGKVANFVVKDLSRFGRDYLKVGMFTEVMFPEKNVRFLAINDDVDSFREDDNSLAPFRNMFNEWYARDCSKKIKAVKRMKGERGEPLANIVPYGYLKAEDFATSKKWLVDEEAAVVIQRIFREFTSGKSKTQIAKKLRADKVLIPSAHKLKLGLKTSARPAQDDSLWSAEQVNQILKRYEYCGYTVNFKTYKPSYKIHKCVANPRENWRIFANHHEKIIDEETYQLAQSMMKTKQRYKKHDKVGLFTGLVFCADCVHRHYFSGASESYYCSGFNSRLKYCSVGSHLIKEENLAKIVLADFRNFAKKYAENEDELLEFLREKAKAEDLKKLNAERQTFAKNSARLTALENIFAQLYEDNVSGKISDEQFAKLSARYEAERKNLEIEGAELREKLDAETKKAGELADFAKVLGTYLKPSALTAEMVRELVARIEVGQPSGGGKNRVQEVRIFWRFVGETEVK